MTYYQMGQQLHAIFFCRGCHWITQWEGVINLLHCEVDVASKRAIANVFPDSDINFNVPSVPMQL